MREKDFELKDVYKFTNFYGFYCTFGTSSLLIKNDRTN